ncbi:hypothetical protein [Acetobacter orleanensis]|uniref:Uncharacterized protein n=1 Tax=Acetobacter orleanensis TaxID=104099 RepID=A0A4Y3TP00_9PROT|nr:hypothetical protein [Acetobacter orleanensis]KXV64976.1 hypothetical protein AD949_05195 [Acetobacter orleanensis]PCD78875.1 hypothetical protein CO710_09705 [Acetobacter orleanensis]GAN69646.1 hypothetical protein Abol_048_060 [Acetobacter orleanensis JCM 7639]GBR29172.1 hypothetical protein AA0473_1956 [Acetobacter orleanensis NRIC 0473]GEB83528.1 hypothetical protein AOR01nite_20050 [Acetobacter orleanensis]
MSSSSSPYVRRLLWIAGCLAGGFAVLCVSGWSYVVNSSTQDTAWVTALRWLPIMAGVITVGVGFYLLYLPVPEDPEDFFLPDDADGELERTDGK